MTQNAERPEVEPFPSTTLGVAGALVCVIGVIIGIATAAGGVKLQDGIGISVALGFVVLLILVVMGAQAVRSAERTHSESRTS